MKNDMKGHRENDEWNIEFCNDLIKTLKFQINSDKRDQAYGGYYSHVIERIPGFDGMFHFASEDAKKKYGPFKDAAQNAYKAINAGNATIDKMCKDMVTILEKKKKEMASLRKSK